MAPTTLSFMASSHPFLPPARPENFHLLYRSASFPKQVHNVGRGCLASTSPYPGRPRFAASFVVTSSIHEYQKFGHQNRHFQSSNFSPWKNESLPGNDSQRTSKAVPKAGDGGNGAGSDDEDSLCNRRLVILSYDEHQQHSTPYPHEVIEKLEHERWIPQYCFVRDSLIRPKTNWEKMNHDGKGPWPGTQVLLPPDKNPLALSREKFETTFGKYLSVFNRKIETIMVMTIGEKEKFQVLVEYLAEAKNIRFDGLPYVALLERKDRGDSWSKDQKLKKNEWKLVYPERR